MDSAIQKQDGSDKFEPGRRVRNKEYGEGDILGKCKHEQSWDVEFDNFPFWMCAHESDLELLPVEPEQTDATQGKKTMPIFTPNQRVEYLEEFAWLPGVYLEPSHVEGFPHKLKCDSGKVLCAADGSIRAADSIPLVPDAIYLAPPPEPIPAPATYKWGQPVIVDGGTDNAREGIVICDEPSKTDRSWFVSLSNYCNQWIREDRLIANPKIGESKPAASVAEDYSGYGWIKVKKFTPEKYATIEERYTALELHHVQETSFLIDKVRELAAQVTPKPATDPTVSLGGQDAELAKARETIKFLEAYNATLFDVRDSLNATKDRCRCLSDEAKEAAHYAHSCPEHTQSTLKTLAFRLDCLARGVVGGE